MKLDFRREGQSLFVNTTIYVPGHGDISYTATIGLGNEYYAGFVVDALKKQMGDEMNAMRRESYEEGWKAAKAKKASKETWFSSVFGVQP